MLKTEVAALWFVLKIHDKIRNAQQGHESKQKEDTRPNKYTFG